MELNGVEGREEEEEEGRGEEGRGGEGGGEEKNVGGLAEYCEFSGCSSS